MHFKDLFSIEVLFLILVEKKLFIQEIFNKSLLMNLKLIYFLNNVAVFLWYGNIDISVAYKYTITLSKKLFNYRSLAFSSDVPNTW